MALEIQDNKDDIATAATRCNIRVAVAELLSLILIVSIMTESGGQISSSFLASAKTTPTPPPALRPPTSTPTPTPTPTPAPIAWTRQPERFHRWIARMESPSRHPYVSYRRCYTSCWGYGTSRKYNCAHK
jgi:hypothetical protein